MSDHEAETTETAWEHNGSHNANGSDQGSIAVANDEHTDSGLDDRAKFLADLARVMQTTAATEQARNAEGTEQRRQAHLATIRARESAEADELRELAKLDIKDVDGWSEEEIKRIKAERERRIATRRDQLQHRLEEHRGVITREIEAVEAAIGAYRIKVDAFFARINNETDPVAIAREAGHQPQFPDLELIKPEPVSYAAGEQITGGEETVLAEAVSVQVVDGVSEAEDVTEASTKAAHEESGEDGSMVGVMDPEAGSRPFDTPWESGTSTAEGVEHSDEAVAAEAEVVDVVETTETEATEAETVETVEAETVEAETVEAETVEAEIVEAEIVEAETVEAVEGEAGEEISEGSEELEPVAAQAVVMPRSSGAGSWLRWPNSSSGGNDQGR